MMILTIQTPIGNLRIRIVRLVYWDIDQDQIIFRAVARVRGKRYNVGGDSLLIAFKRLLAQIIQDL